AAAERQYLPARRLRPRPRAPPRSGPGGGARNLGRQGRAWARAPGFRVAAGHGELPTLAARACTRRKDCPRRGAALAGLLRRAGRDPARPLAALQPGAAFVTLNPCILMEICAGMP